jgi:hypothetical protein
VGTEAAVLFNPYYICDKPGFLLLSSHGTKLNIFVHYLYRVKHPLAYSIFSHFEPKNFSIKKFECFPEIRKTPINLFSFSLKYFSKILTSKIFPFLPYI